MMVIWIWSWLVTREMYYPPYTIQAITSPVLKKRILRKARMQKIL